MENLRRIAAILIALSLGLPQRSCENGGKVDIDYPLSNADGFWSIAFIAAFFVLPLLLQLLTRYRVTTRIAGVLVTAAGLYYIAYASTILATKMLIGWYAYTVGAGVYCGITVLQLTQILRGSARARRDHGA